MGLCEEPARPVNLGFIRSLRKLTGGGEGSSNNLLMYINRFVFFVFLFIFKCKVKRVNLGSTMWRWAVPGPDVSVCVCPLKTNATRLGEWDFIRFHSLFVVDHSLQWLDSTVQVSRKTGIIKAEVIQGCSLLVFFQLTGFFNSLFRIRRIVGVGPKDSCKCFTFFIYLFLTCTVSFSSNATIAPSDGESDVRCHSILLK